MRNQAGSDNTDVVAEEGRRVEALEVRTCITIDS